MEFIRGVLEVDMVQPCKGSICRSHHEKTSVFLHDMGGNVHSVVKYIKNTLFVYSHLTGNPPVSIVSRLEERILFQS